MNRRAIAAKGAVNRGYELVHGLPGGALMGWGNFKNLFKSLLPTEAEKEHGVLLVTHDIKLKKTYNDQQSGAPVVL